MTSSQELNTEIEDLVLNVLEESMASGQPIKRFSLVTANGDHLEGKKATLHVLNEQTSKGLMLMPHPIKAKHLRLWTGLNKTNMAHLFGFKQGYQWQLYEVNDNKKYLNVDSWTLLHLRLGIHPKYKLVLKDE
ncbi:TPA: hypothetical protein MW242_003298 [Acinetobacter baumannii]|nr:hypothetical protein [Acinetobacter baumannii]